MGSSVCRAISASVVSTAASCAVCVSMITGHGSYKMLVTNLNCEKVTGVHTIKLISNGTMWAVIGGLLGAETTCAGI